MIKKYDITSDFFGIGIVAKMFKNENEYWRDTGKTVYAFEEVSQFELRQYIPQLEADGYTFGSYITENMVSREKPAFLI